MSALGASICLNMHNLRQSAGKKVVNEFVYLNSKPLSKYTGVPPNSLLSFRQAPLRRWINPIKLGKLFIWLANAQELSIPPIMVVSRE